MINTSTQTKGTPSSKRNPCPICQKDHGCKISDSKILCLRGDRSFNVPGWKWVKEARNGMGGVFVPDSNETSTFDREEWQRKQAELKEAERKRKSSSLSESERDRNARKILRQLGLSSRHRADLHRRGLTDSQIEEIGFKTVEAGQRLILPVSPDFPGVNATGDQLKNTDGYLVPLFNEFNQIIGFQIAADDRERAKYLWLSQDSDYRLSNGEAPLTVRRVDGDPDVRLAEGTSKPLIASCRHNKSFIGAAGGNFSASPKQLKRNLEALNPRLVIIDCDSGVGVNHHVHQRDLATIELVKSFGYEVRIEWWGQFEKTPNNDIDEITDLTAAQLLTPDEFRRILGVSSSKKDRRSDKLISKEQWEQQNFLNWVKNNFNRAAYKFAKRFGKLPGNPQAVKRKTEIAKNDQVFALVKWKPPIQFVTDTLRWTPRVITSYQEWLYINDDWRETLPYLPGFLPCYEEWLKLGRPRYEFQGGDRKSLIVEAHSKGYWGVKDSSSTGQGKSHDSGLLRLEDLGIDPDPKDEKGKEIKKPRLFRIDPNYRNPSTSTVEQKFKPLISRHGGLDYDHSRQTPMGFPHVVKYQKGSGKPHPDIVDKCDLFDSFRAVGEKGKFVAGGDDSPICMACKKNSDCDFRKTRASILQDNNYISADINSMSNPAYDDVIMIEESGVTLSTHKQFEVTVNHIHQAIGKLFTRASKSNKDELMLVLTDILDLIAVTLEEFEPENKRYGANHWEIKKHFPKRQELEALIQEHYYDINFEIEVDDKAKDSSEYTRVFKDNDNGLIAHILPTIKGIEAEVNRLLTENLAELAREALSPEGKAKAIRENLIFNMVSPILQSIGGNRRVNLQIKPDRINGKKLVITQPNYRQTSVVKAAHFAIFLDATESVDKLEEKLNCNEHEHILEISQIKPSYQNLTIILINGIGACGKQRESGESEFAMKNRIEKALIAIADRHPDDAKALIDHKQFVGDWEHLVGDEEDKPFAKKGWWFNHTRGSNEFLSTRVMVNVGMPVPNFGDKGAQYQTMTGEIVNPAQMTGRYGAWLFSQIISEIIQDIGRPRSNLRPHEEIYSYHLGNFTEQHIEAIKKAYPGAKVEVMDIYDLCPEAAPKGVQMLRGIIKATAEAVKAGITPTASAIAKQLNTTTSNVSQTLKRSLGITFRWLKICSQNLYRAINRKSEQADHPDLTEDELRIAREYLPILAQQLDQGVTSSDDTLEDLANISEGYGAKAFERILQSVPPQAALTLYRLFISALPEPSKDDLRKFIDSSPLSVAITT